MSLKIVYILSILLIFIAPTSKYSYKKKVYERNFTNLWSKEIKSLYDATQIGHKASLPKETLSSFKSLGIIHLLTPSGIHLASILIVLKKILPSYIIKLTVLISYIFIISIGGFHSIRRILSFYLLNGIIKSSKINFYVCFIIDLIAGGYMLSPLSFSLSFLFWGTIIFSKENKVEVAINLFLSQLLTCFLLKGKVSLLSGIINPVLTFIFSSIFPFLSFQYWINFSFLELYAFNILDFFNKVILYLNNSLSFSIIEVSPLVLLFFITQKKAHLKVLYIYLIFSSSLLNQTSYKVYKLKYYLKDNSCKEFYGNYGYDKKCYKKDIKKAQTSWAL